MTSFPNGLRPAAIAASFMMATALAAAPTADAQEKAEAPKNPPAEAPAYAQAKTVIHKKFRDSCLFIIGEDGEAHKLMMGEEVRHKMRGLRKHMRGLRHKLRGMRGGERDHAGGVGLRKLIGGMVVDQNVKKIDRNTKEVTTLRRSAEGKLTTVKRTIKKTKGGADITGTITTDDGKTASFKESFSQDKAGAITTSREFTNFEGRSRSIKKTVTKDGDKKKVKTEITRADGETVVFERDGEDRGYNFRKKNRKGKGRSIKKTVERDDDGKVQKTKVVIATGDDEHHITITKERSGDSATVTIERPEGTVHTITRPCPDDDQDDE